MTVLKDHWSLQKGATPILMSAYANRLDVVASLAAAGANVLAKTKTEDTILHGAAKHQNPDGIEINAAANLANGVTLCGTACSSNRAPRSFSLITKGADVKAASPIGWTPFAWAIQSDDVDHPKPEAPEVVQELKILYIF